MTLKSLISGNWYIEMCFWQCSIASDRARGPSDLEVANIVKLILRDVLLAMLDCFRPCTRPIELEFANIVKLILRCASGNVRLLQTVHKDRVTLKSLISLN